jgi:hypothetical protein
MPTCTTSGRRALHSRPTSRRGPGSHSRIPTTPGRRCRTCTGRSGSTQSLRVVARPAQIRTTWLPFLMWLLETVHGERMLMFSSDYRHWDADNPEYALRGFPDDWKERIFFENARETFSLDVPAPAGAL